MSAIATMTINDGQATPAAHTFGVSGKDAQGIAKWVDRSSGIALGFPAISLLVRNPTGKSRTYKVTAKVVTPVLEVTSPSTATGIQPAPTLAYNLLANVEFVLPDRSTLAERKNLIAFVANFLAHTNMQNAVQNFEPVY